MATDMESISEWLDNLKTNGDEAAAALLWDRYFSRLVGLARKRMMKVDFQRRASDEEDAALSAFHDFCRAVREDSRYAGLEGRDNLWKVLVSFTVNKVQTHISRERAAKRGGGRVQGEAAVAGTSEESSTPAGLDRLGSAELAPDLEAEFDEKFSAFLGRLEDREAEVAKLRFDGSTTEEIAVKVGLAPATVRRVLVAVRETLAEVFEVKLE